MGIAPAERERLAAWAREEMADVPWYEDGTEDISGVDDGCGHVISDADPGL
jgi:hypothetical protein